MLVTCHNCKVEFEKQTRHYNYAVKNGMRHFCDVKCAGASRGNGKRSNPVNDPNVLNLRKIRAKKQREAREKEKVRPLTYLSNSDDLVPTLIKGANYG